MSSWSARRWVTSAMVLPDSTAALSAATLLSRPTWRGTIISGKMTVSRRATSGSSWIFGSVRSAAGLDGRLAIGFSCLVGVGALVRGGTALVAGADHRRPLRSGGGGGWFWRGVRRAGGRGFGLGEPRVVEPRKDTGPKAALAGQEDPDPRAL